jgi:hypothetical protein
MDVASTELRLSAQRALLGAIHPEVRLVKVKRIGAIITVTSVLDTLGNDECVEALSIAAAEIIADFPDCELHERVLVTFEPLPSEDALTEGWVYQRADA